MKNIPRVYIDKKLEVGKTFALDDAQAHYLTKVMRTDKCLVFNNGVEYVAKLTTEKNRVTCYVSRVTNHPDPGNDITFCFAPIKKTDDMLNMATQMGVTRLQPVLTDRTVAHHVNWSRMEKIIVEAAEQSNRNSVPELLPPKTFKEFLQESVLRNQELVFADERAAHNSNYESRVTNHDKNSCAVFIGPEGGFSDAEFAALDAVGAIGISLGKTILRAETAAVAAMAQLIIKN
ncbi:MAG: 16S rRNA (uracil(1498)-N(3))-methyltransferase [Rickettsiales bacterium]|nr:16S rRNA (uracil(1498)-N(3))-methyltransferase [Rickettsiales bacterium]